MHPLLIPYALLTALFVLHFHQRDRRVGSAGVAVVAVAMLALLSAAMVLRPARGDSGRYYEHFLHVRSLDFSGMMQYERMDPLFKLLNWLVGQLGQSSELFFSAAFVLFVGVIIWAFHRLLGARQAAALFMCYAAYPFFITYGANGLRQGLALACMLMALVQFNRGNMRSGALWLLPMPFWHGGSLLGATVVALYVLMLRYVPRAQQRWRIVGILYAASVMLSVTGLNEALLGRLPDIIDLEARHQGYFLSPDELGTVYQTGFRLDFTLFSLTPLFSALLLRHRGEMFSFRASGWWLSIYLALNCIFHLFSFAPYSDRFSAYSWFLMPLVLFMQIRASGNPWLRSAFIVCVAAVNIIMLQFYTGNSIRPPEWW